MPQEFACPACGETENLTGERRPDGIHLTCGACGNTWPRYAARACATCGGTRLHERTQALTQYSRGTQLSVVGWQKVPLCETCDAAMLARSSEGKPIPHTYRPAAIARRDAGGDDVLDTQILPQ
ncbi:MAG: hypothetical protein GEV03_06705 [Streptosporangiales bacterium]|nr:hypothetical protein [Streptosporangiales bacterium]